MGNVRRRFGPEMERLPAAHAAAVWGQFWAIARSEFAGERGKWGRASAWLAIFDRQNGVQS